MEVFAAKLRNVFMDGQYSDLVVACKDRTWNVHKLVVCSQSEFFSKACNGDFTEAQENKITLQDDDPEVVEVMLHYFYHFDYSDEKGDGMAPMLLNLNLLAIADKYLIEPLQKLAIEKFNRRAYDDWTTDAFAEALEILFESSYGNGSLETLRLIVLDVVNEHAKELFNDETYGRFQMATVSAPAFLFEYVKSITAEPAPKPKIAQLSNMMWFQCPGWECQKHAAIFAVRTSVPNHFKFNCPLRCIVNQKRTFWDHYKTAV